MRGFFETVPAPDVADVPITGREPMRAVQAACGRIAVYDSLTAAPRVEDVVAGESSLFIEQLSARTYQCAHEQGGAIPFTLIREIVENFIHAHFSEVIVTVMNGGNTVRFSDQGPGIPDKDRAFLPGFSTATAEMKYVIRGVGSGLPIVKECLSFSDGTVSVDDNLGRGTVVTLSMQPPAPSASHEEEEPQELPSAPRLSVRQKRVLSLVLELGAVGPSIVSRELSVGLSTAYRDLAFLEQCGLIATDETGKRSLTEEGVVFLDDLFST